MESNTGKKLWLKTNSKYVEKRWRATTFAIAEVGKVITKFYYVAIAILENLAFW